MPESEEGRQPGGAEAFRFDRAEPRLDAYEALIKACWDKLWRYAYRMCGSYDEAEDLLSETLIEGYKDFARFRGDCSFDRWIYRIMTTTRIDMVRRARRRATESLESGTGDDKGQSARDIPDAAQNPETLLVEPVLEEEIQGALNALSETFRATIILADVEGLDYAEIASTLRVPIGTVRSRIHRARAQLRRALAEFVAKRTRKRVGQGGDLA